MLRALGLAAYLETHARRAYSAGPEAETTAAKAILSRIRKGDLIDGFTARDVHQRGWSNLSDRGQVQAGLDLLCDLDWIFAADKRGDGRRSSLRQADSTSGTGKKQLAGTRNHDPGWNWSWTNSERTP